MTSTMLARMRALRMGDGEKPTSAPWPSGHSSRQEARMRALRRGPIALGRGRGNNNNNNNGGSAPPSYSGWSGNGEPASPITSSDEEDAQQEDRDMQRMREEATMPHAADNSIIETFSDVESDEEEEQEELSADPVTAEEYAARMRSYETTTVDEYDGRLRQSRYERQDSPRPGQEEVDEAETERARQAGEREWYANWAHMHVDHYRNGTMTWEELLVELRRDGPQ